MLARVARSKIIGLVDQILAAGGLTVLVNDDLKSKYTRLIGNGRL